VALRSSDVLSDLVVGAVPTEVRATMTEDQIKAVRGAATRRHAVDVRFTVPLLVTQLYVVLLVGRDTRSAAASVARERRARAGFHLSSFAVGVLAAIAVLGAAVALYVVKSRAGIDLFPGHAGDVVPFAR
jgi:hypothetical protein